MGGGDWAENRIIPDIIRSLKNNERILIRNPLSTRPWQHVIEPLSGYLILAEKLSSEQNKFSSSFNFGPFADSNRSVRDLVDECLKHWEGEYFIKDNPEKLHEAGVLHLSIEKAMKHLFGGQNGTLKTQYKTINWYKNVYKENMDPIECSISDLKNYLNEI